jgi:hypothetical protein
MSKRTQEIESLDLEYWTRARGRGGEKTLVFLVCVLGECIMYIVGSREKEVYPPGVEPGESG